MKTKLLFLFLFSISLCGFAQKHTLTGTIYDEDKNVLADANVIIKNSDKGVSTNEKGQFSIAVAPKDVLEISYLGFDLKKVKINDEQKIKIILERSFNKLDIVFIHAKGAKLKSGRIDCPEPSSKLNQTLRCSTVGIKIKYHNSSEKTTQILFPNPSSNGLFQLQLNTNYTKLTVEVFNMNGQLIQSQTHNKLSKIPQIDLSKQPKGIYLVRIIADGNVLETKKAIRS